MSYQEKFSQWEQTVSRAFAHLSCPQAYILACWSYAMVFTKSVGLTQVSFWLLMTFGGTANAWRQRRRYWCYDASDKKGEHRVHLEVRTCFAPLCRWIFSWWSTQEQRRLALVLDASQLGECKTRVSSLHRLSRLCEAFGLAALTVSNIREVEGPLAPEAFGWA